MNCLEDLLELLAEEGRTDGVKVDPDKNKGRECYAFSEVEDRLLKKLEKEAELILKNLPEEKHSIDYDEIGNLYITLNGEGPSAKKVVVGSHIDSVTNGGNYDGVLGICMGFDILKEIVGNGESYKNDYVVAVFRAEESSPKTGVACLGSAIATGEIDKEKLGSIKYKKNDETSIPLSEHLEGRYKKDIWERVLKSLENPTFTPENTILFEEPHIEQSGVLQAKNYHVGIVNGNMGGSERLEVESEEALEEEDIEFGERKWYKIIIKGEEAHTGGAPMNNYEGPEGKGHLYRQDAIIGGAYFINWLIYLCKKKGVEIAINEASVDEKRAFTTVPPRFEFKIACPEESSAKFCRILEEVKQKTKSAKGMEVKSNEEEEVSRTRLDPEEVLKFLITAHYIEYAAIQVNDRKVGKVRSTVTDLTLKPGEKASFKVDMREVDHTEHNKLSKVIRGIISEIKLAIISETRSKSRPLDAEIAEAKEKIAENLGLKYLKMSSVPGHDALNFAKAGIRTGGTFIRHDGVSHNPKEYVESEYIEKGLALVREHIKKALAGKLN